MPLETIMWLVANFIVGLIILAVGLYVTRDVSGAASTQAKTPTSE
ncbi:MAG TPA: hypothetical protein VF223_15430 [Trebonia sp.]|jgi:hypothetical protein